LINESAEAGGVPSRRVIVACWTFIYLGVALAAAIALQEPPAERPADVPAMEFSSQRAFQHVQAIAREPHPAGSAEIAKVRAYLEHTIDAMKLPRSTQSGSWSRPDGSSREIANVAARVNGSATRGSKAVLLMAHYDSVPIAPGACDDGSGTATLLETLRALKAGPLPKRDIIALFTDGEELGLLGAKMFIGKSKGGYGDGHPWMEDVGLVLNFESSGSHGPCYLFETSEENGWLIHEFARADPIAIGNSLAPVVYRLTGGSTDMNSFFAAGVPGLNFVFFEGKECYHTPADSPENLDRRSLQHQGLQALALARHFADLEQEAPREPNVIYFNPVGRWFVHYSISWAKPLALGAVLLYVGVLYLAWRSGRVTWRLVIGLLLFPSAIAVGTLGAYGAWWLMERAGVRAEGDAIRGPVASIILVVSLLVFLGVYAVLWKRIGVHNLDLGSLASWAILSVATAWLLPEGSFAPVWPLLFRLATTALAWRISWPPAAMLLTDLGTLPAFTIIGAGAYAMFASLSPSSVTIAVAIALLVPGAILPQICRVLDVVVTTASRHLLRIGATITF
jgi:Peptidase family M28